MSLVVASECDFRH